MNTLNHRKMILSNEQELDMFLEYLKDTLIPDLHISGSDATADDFETCVEAIETLLNRLDEQS